MSERYGYVGNNPSNSPIVVARQIYQPTGIQTSFNFVSGYQIGYVDAYVNGSRLIEGIDYYATDGVNVDLLTPIGSGSKLELIAYKAYNVAFPSVVGDLNVSGTLSGVSAAFVSVAASTLVINGNGLFADNLTVQDNTSTNQLYVTGVTTTNRLVSTSIATTSISASGIVTATGGFVGNVTGDVTGTATTALGLSGIPNIQVGDARALTLGVGVGLTILTALPNGKVGIGSTQPQHRLSVSGMLQTKGFVETQENVSLGGTVLTLDASQATAFTHTLTNHIGIVSFTGIATSRAGAQTFTVLLTQAGTPYNTTNATGIGMQKATIVTEGGVGFSTHIKVSMGSTILLTSTAGALDILTFIVSYNGATPIQDNSFTVVGFGATDFRGLVN